MAPWSAALEASSVVVDGATVLQSTNTLSRAGPPLR